MLRLLTFICLCIFAHSAVAINDYVVKQWSTSDGLASQSVTSIVQDKQGYIWVGTQFGLSRFDGMNFSNFSTSNSDFLQSNSITKLLLDQQGYLWIGTKLGLVRLNPDTFEFTQYNVKGAVHDLLADDEGRIWIAANGLYFYFNDVFMPLNQLLDNNQTMGWPNTNTSRGQHRISRIIGSVSKMALSPDGIWLVNDRTLLRLSYQLSSKSAIKLEVSATISLPESLAQTPVTDLSWLEGNLFLASEAGAFKLDVEDELRPINLPLAINKATYKIMSDPDGALWVSTEGRLLYRDTSSDWEAVDAAELEQTWFSDIIRDRQDNIWLGSSSDGLWQAYKGQVERHSTFAGIKEQIEAVTLSARGELWVASRSGVGYFNDDNEFINQIPYEKLGNAKVSTLHFQGNRLFIGTSKNGAFYWQNGQLNRVPGRALRFNGVNAIEPSPFGLWFGTERGLFRQGFDGVFKSFIYNAKLNSKNITYLIDKGSEVWIGTTKGAYHYNVNGLKQLGQSLALEGANVSSILEAPNNIMFIGTITDGLFYRTAEGVWHQLDASKGLPYGAILSLYYDQTMDRVWVSNLKGVYRMPLSQFSSQVENVQVELVINSLDRKFDGKLSQCCAGKGQSAVMSTGSSLWYPSLQGLVAIPKNIELFGDTELSPMIESISSEQGITPVNNQQETLTLDQRDLTISYTAIDFYAPNSLEFRYKLVNFDDTWRIANKRREAIYTNLPPGVFTFELEVKRQSMTWDNSVKTRFTFEIAKRFDETVYFRLLIVSLFISLLYVSFLLYRSQERRKQAELEKLVEARTHELTETNSKLNQANSQLKQVSHSDELTGLRSRRFLFDQLPKDIEHYQRNRQSLEEQGKALALVILNLDDFSRINDAYGPISGDSCLQQVATLLNSKTQGSDYVVRWSGDEFLLLLRDMRRNAIDDYVKNLCRAISEHQFKLPNGKSIQLTSSLGWAFYPLPLVGGQIIGWETSINLADLALHKVKEKGRNGVATFTFDEQLDAFEFEDSEMIETQLTHLLTSNLATLQLWMQERWTMNV